ncbi:hypothetical protein [Streptomyces sp. NBC_00343]|uniref:hypothetical protein n=1 Tax=Streptomyces sp. NBC_00343 TaxID=2975719 RepID=UPI002E2DAD8B|nr:hypothetical protein [Streptomyces sp. NBC_00343]
MSAIAFTSSRVAGAVTSRPARRRTIPPADSQADLPASPAVPEPTAPNTAPMAPVDGRSSTSPTSSADDQRINLGAGEGW